MLSYENKARAPLKGLRVKLRILLKSLGLVGKFRIDHHRRFGLIVTYSQEQQVPIISEFEGFPIKFQREIK